MAIFRNQNIWLLLALACLSCQPAKPETMQFPDYLKDQNPEKYLKYDKPANKSTVDEIDATLKTMVEDLKEVHTRLASGELKFRLQHDHIMTRYGGIYDTPDFKKRIMMEIETETQTPAIGNIIMYAGVTEYQESSKISGKTDRSSGIVFLRWEDILIDQGSDPSKAKLNSIDVPKVAREYTLEKGNKKIIAHFRENQSIKSFLMVIKEAGDKEKSEYVEWDKNGKCITDKRH